jgi:hypothetical protein
MNYTSVKNPVWVNEEHTMINCEVNFNHLVQEYAPFTAVPSGDYEHTHRIFEECVRGDWGPIGDYVPLVEMEFIEPTSNTA